MGNISVGYWKLLVTYVAMILDIVTPNPEKVGLATVALETDNELVSFIGQLVNRHFSVCSAIFLQDMLENSSQKNRINALVLRTNTETLTKYVVNFHNDTLLRTISGPAWTYQKVSTTPRHRNTCFLTILAVSSVKPDFMNQVRSLVAPSFMPFSRNDRDYYIFISNPKFHKAILKMDSVLSKIKFKIAVGVTGNRVKVTSVDIFGSPPKPVSISTDEIREKSDIFPDFLRDMKGHTVKISIPFAIAMLEAYYHGEKVVNNGKRGRWTYLFNEYLVRKFNLTYHMFVSAGGGGSGLLLRNGTWIGVVGDLYYGRADFGLAIANTDSRLLSIGFTDTYFHAGCLTFVTGQPTEVYSAMALFWPFQASVWMGILGSSLISFIFFFLVTKGSQYLKLETSHMPVAKQILLLLAPVLEQDIHLEPSSTPLRSFLALWSFFAVIVTTLYRSKLVTLLAFPVLGQLPQTFQQLAFSDLQVGFSKNGDSAYNTFVKSQDPVYVQLLQYMEVFKGVNLSCLQKVVTTDKYSCIAYDFDVVYLQQRNFSDVESRKLRPSGASTYNIWMGLAIQPNSIFKDSFGHALGQTLSFHLGEIWDQMDMYENVRKPKLKWWAERNHTEKIILLGGEETEESNLTLNNIKSVFYVMFFCLIVSLLAFLYEFRISACHIIKSVLLAAAIFIRY